jgi:hypothetical protein
MVPILVEAVNGHYEASVYGSPGYRVAAATKAEAIATLQQEMKSRAARGEVVWVDAPKLGLTNLAGKYGPDPHLDEIVAEAYRHRDEVKAQEFPE